MFVKFGTALFGKVDSIPGTGFVATKFFYVMYIPLIPLDTWFVVEGSEGTQEGGSHGWRGSPIRFSGKSVLWAYGRAVLLIGSVFLGLMAIPGLATSTAAAWAAGFGAAACILAVILSYRFNRASEERAAEIAEAIGLKQEPPPAA